MRKALAFAAVVGLVGLVGPSASAAPPVVKGRFVEAFQRDHQPHRVYWRVAAGHGAKECSVTLHARTTEVSLGTDHVSALTNVFYLRTSGARIALAQALATDGQPTWRVRCTH